MEQSLTSWKWELVMNLPTSFSEVDVSEVYSLPVPHRVLVEVDSHRSDQLDDIPSHWLLSLPNFMLSAL